MPPELEAGSAASTGGGETVITSGGSSAASTGGAAPASTGGAAASTVDGSGGSTGNVLGSTGGTSSASTGYAWQPGWREHMAAGDAKTLTRLQRFADPAALLKSYLELDRRMSAGELKSTLKDGASAEEITAWRKENGIPDKPEGYQAPEGLVVGDEDKPIVDAFTKVAHGMNLKPDQYQGALAWYFEARDQQEAAQADKDAQIARSTQDALRAEWPGIDYRANMNALHSLLDTAPQVTLEDGSKVQLKDLILGARLPNGVPIGSSPEALRWFAQLSREVNPAATVVPPAGANTMQAIDDELADLKKLMGNKNSDYWKGPKAEAKQNRYRELLDTKAKLEAKAGKGK